MLQFLRSNTKIFAWFFVVVLILAFALTSFTYNKHDQYAGEIFGQKVSFQDLRVFETLTRLLPPSKEIAEDPQKAYANTWQQLILSREAQNQKIEVSDAEVRSQVDRVINGESTQRVTETEYKNLLKNWRTTPQEFEKGIREIIRIQKMISAKFAPTVDPTSLVGDAADKKDLIEKANAEKEQKMKDYVTWMSDIFSRAQVVDYSQMRPETIATQEPTA